MIKNLRQLGCLCVGLLWLGVLSLSHAKQNVKTSLKAIKLPQGFSISVYAHNVAGARMMALGDDGTVYVGSREGNVYAVRDKNKDGKAEQMFTIAKGLYLPNGVAFRDGDLYVAEVNQIIRFDDISDQLGSSPKSVVVYDKLPSERHHGWKSLRFGPDGMLYTAVGAPCNICEPPENIFATLVRLKPDGSKFQIIAKGIRNTLGYDWHPVTKKLYFTENGRDYLGDDVPPDELNRLDKIGSNFGYPYCHAGEIADPEFGSKQKCSKFVAPAWRFGAHKAPLGMRFYRGDAFPSEYQDQLFVAQHGSWNRTKPHGYQVVMVTFKDGVPVAEKPFAEGWLTKDEQVLGRPVDLLELPDGRLLVSDDLNGVIYQISYQK